MTQAPPANLTDPAPTAAGEALCPDCGYDLHGLPSDTGHCPECGLPIHWGAARESRIPWVHRRRIGFLRGYFRTVWLVVARPRAFAAEVVRPARRSDCEWFWAITVLLTAIPLSLIALVTEPLDPQFVNAAAIKVADGTPSWEGWVLPAVFGAESAIVRIGCALLWLAAVTRASPVFLWGRGVDPVLRERAAFMSRYTTTPLLMLPAMFAKWAILVLMQPPPGSFSAMLAVMLFFVGMSLAVIDWWWLQVLLVHRATASTRRSVAAALLFPLVWALIAALVLLCIPWLIGYLRISYAALR